MPFEIYELTNDLNGKNQLVTSIQILFLIYGFVVVYSARFLITLKRIPFFKSFIMSCIVHCYYINMYQIIIVSFDDNVSSGEHKKRFKTLTKNGTVVIGTEFYSIPRMCDAARAVLKFHKENANVTLHRTAPVLERCL